MNIKIEILNILGKNHYLSKNHLLVFNIRSSIFVLLDLKLPKVILSTPWVARSKQSVSSYNQHHINGATVSMRPTFVVNQQDYTYQLMMPQESILNIFGHLTVWKSKDWYLGIWIGLPLGAWQAMHVLSCSYKSTSCALLLCSLLKGVPCLSPPLSLLSLLCPGICLCAPLCTLSVTFSAFFLFSNKPSMWALLYGVSSSSHF